MDFNLDIKQLMNDFDDLYSLSDPMEKEKGKYVPILESGDIDQFKSLMDSHSGYFFDGVLCFHPSDLCKYVTDLVCKSKNDNFSIVLYEKLILAQNFNLLFLNYFLNKYIEEEYYEIIHYVINDKYDHHLHLLNMVLSSLKFDFKKVFSCQYEFNKKFSLLLAIKKNEMDFIKMYIDDVNINFDDGCLLECAVSHNNIDASKFLINCGALINNKKNSILFHALMNHNIEMVQLLIETGIDLQESFGTTYSTLTSSNQCEFNSQKTKPIIKLLADSGANMEDFANMLYIKLFPEAGRQTYYSY